MDYLKNHCWCSSSHWDNGDYNCQIIVSLSSYEKGCEEDWEALTHKTKVFSQDKMDEHKALVKRCIEKYPDMYTEADLVDRAGGMKEINKFNPEVLEWLEANIPDHEGGKGWCVGSDDYNAMGSCSRLSVFFQLRRDAMKFIKTWSKWKKPIYYTQYFTDVRQKLDLSTGKYVDR